MTDLGRRVYGLGALALGVIGLVWGDFASVWQPVPADVPDRPMLAYLVGATLATSGLTLLWRRTAVSGALTLSILYALGVLLLHVPRVVAHPLALSPWAGVAEQMALVSGGLIALALCLEGDARRLKRAGWMIFGLCCLVFGTVHFQYEHDTAAMVPKFLPLGGVFWARITGIAHVAAGLAILSGIRARMAAVLLTIMFASFGILIHAPLLASDFHNHVFWVMNAMNLALTGSAWLVADSLRGHTDELHP